MFGSSPARTPAVAPRPPVHHHQPAPMQQAPAQGGMMSGLGGALATGMAMGAGSEIAHQAIRGIMGSGSSGHGAPAQQQQAQAPPTQYAEPGYAAQQQQQVQQNPCASFNQYLLSCLKDNANNVAMCQSNMDMLQQCEKDNTRYMPQF